ncbi:MAG: MarR family winged helix-turn-helix transcriptional regulator [Nocardioidaceae bacterium]
MPGPAGVAAMRQIEAEVLTLLRRVRRTSVENARLVHPELTTSGYAVLLFVVEHQPTRAADVVEQLDMDKGAVSRQVSQLEHLGLVSREADPDDGRAYRLVLSDQGRDRIAVLRRHRREDLEGRLASWSERDLEVFADRLARYNASFEG